MIYLFQVDILIQHIHAPGLCCGLSVSSSSVFVGALTLWIQKVTRPCVMCSNGVVNKGAWRHQGAPLV